MAYTNLIQFGHNIFNYFSTKYSKEDCFYLSVNSYIFDECLNGLKKEPLFQSFKEQKVTWNIESSDKSDKYYLALAIAAYQVLLASEVKDNPAEDSSADTYKTYTEKLRIAYSLNSYAELNNLLQGKQTEALWSTVKSLFLSEKKMTLYLPESSANYVSYPLSQVFFLNQNYRRSLINISNLSNLKNYPRDFGEKILNDFNRTSIPEENLMRISEIAKKIAGNATDNNCKKSASSVKNKAFNSETKIHLYVKAYSWFEYEIKVFENGSQFFYNDGKGLLSFLEKLLKKYKNIYFYQSDIFSDDSSKVFTCSFELDSNAKDFYVLSLNDSLKEEVLDCLFGSSNAFYLYKFSECDESLKVIINQSDDRVSLQGGIKVRYNTWLEDCVPECFSDGSPFDKVGPGMHKIEHAGKTITISILKHQVADITKYSTGLYINDSCSLNGLMCNSCNSIEDNYFERIDSLRFRMIKNTMVSKMLGGLSRWRSN